MTSHGFGSLTLNVEANIHIRLSPVYYAPDSQCNIVAARVIPELAVHYRKTLGGHQTPYVMHAAESLDFPPTVVSSVYRDGHPLNLRNQPNSAQVSSVDSLDRLDHLGIGCTIRCTVCHYIASYLD